MVRAVDIHSHLYPPRFVAYLMARSEPPWVRDVGGIRRFMLFSGDTGVPMTDEFTTVEAKLEFMDRASIAHSVISLGNPWLDLDAGPQTIGLANELNVELCETVNGRDRLSALGVLPNHDVGSAVSTVETLASAGQVVGLVAGTQIARQRLDDAELSPLWSALAEAKLPVLVHPQAGLAAASMRGYGQALTLALSFPFETTTAIGRMLAAGVFDRHPDLRIVAAHGAGALPYLLGRLRRAAEVDPVTTSLGSSLPHHLYSDSITFSASSLRNCVDVLGAERVMFGTDHPFPIADAESGLADVRSLSDHGVDDADLLLWANAHRLFGLRDRANT